MDNNTNIKRELNRRKKEFMRNIPQLITVMILIIVVLLTFADFKLSKVMSWNFAIKTVAFVVLSYLMYYTKKYLGRKNGQKDSTYREAKADHAERCEAADVYDEEYSLDDFCQEWTIWEREKARRRVLSGSGVTEEEWSRFSCLGRLASMVVLRKKKIKKLLSKEKISEEEYTLLMDLKKIPTEKRITIVRACVIEKQELTSTDIIYESSSWEKRDRTPINIRKKDLTNDIISLLPLTIMMIGVIAFIPELDSVKLSSKTILYGLLRIISLLATAFKGEMNGETIYTVDSVENFKIQRGFFELYSLWKRRKKTPVTDEKSNQD